MRKMTMLGLSTLALCIGVLLGAAGNLGHGHGVIKAAHADINTGGSGGAKCPNGSTPSCAMCNVTADCIAACAGGLYCDQTWRDGVSMTCHVSNNYCLSGTTKIGGPGSPPIGIGR